VIGLEHIVKVYNGTYKELADKLGITASTVTDWISTRRPIPKNKLKALSEMFGKDEEIFQKELNEVEKLQIELDFLKMQSKKDAHQITLPFKDEYGFEYEVDRWIDPHEDERRIKTHELEIETVMLKLRQILYGEHYEFEAGNEGLKLLELIKRFTTILTEEAPESFSKSQKKEWLSKHNSRINALQMVMYFLGVYRKEWGKPFIKDGNLEHKFYDFFTEEDYIWSKEESKKYNPWDI
jgi:transcriptional regulator with XRE-family HTH domain